MNVLTKNPELENLKRGMTEQEEKLVGPKHISFM